MFSAAFIYRNLRLRFSKRHRFVASFTCGTLLLLLYAWKYLLKADVQFGFLRSRPAFYEHVTSFFGGIEEDFSDTELSAFPDYSKYAISNQNANALPMHISVGFEEAVTEIELEGWEEEWFTEVRFNSTLWGKMKTPKIDFVYNWVNGSEPAFRQTMREYELNSTLNDAEGKWISTHGINRYRMWDELRYSIRSVEKYTGTFRNKIQILVNDVKHVRENGSFEIQKQRPVWLNQVGDTKNTVEVLSQHEFFTKEAMNCLPAFNSRTVESQIFNTNSDTDRIYALSDDMFLGKPYAASDIYSPLFGSSMGFKDNSYNKLLMPNNMDLHRFGEKPGLVYTSWLMNQRFGGRRRKGQVHGGHSISRSLTREAMKSFPSSSRHSSCIRFRNEDLQQNIWFLSFHYTMERHREALLWSYFLRSDKNKNGVFDWDERQIMSAEIKAGLAIRKFRVFQRDNIFSEVPQLLHAAGLEPPKANDGILWTSLDGPYMVKHAKCKRFNADVCFGQGFWSSSSYPNITLLDVFDHISRLKPRCGDCLLQALLSQTSRGFGPLLPKSETHGEERKLILKALVKYQYTIIDPGLLFVMMVGAEQIQENLIDPLLHQGGGVELFGQMCINDDVQTNDTSELMKIKNSVNELFEGLYPEKSPYEI